MNNDDFWTTLAAGHTNTVLSGAMDSHLSGKSLEESFGSVRDLTDKMRAANALSLPVEAGTKVVFAGGMGAYLTYDDIPADGIEGEVVTVKSATGEITHHDGKVFVKWADGKFRPIHAEHLRLAGQGRRASEIKAEFDKVKALAEKRPDSKFLKDLLKQMADKGFTPTDKQMKVVKEIEDEIKQQAEMQKELAGLDKKKARFDPSDIGKEKGPHVQDDEDDELMGSFTQDEHHETKRKHKRKASVIRVASLGDLTQFLKRADGKLVHKSTNDLWSYSKDADGNFLVERLFDDNGEPLQG